MWTTAHLTPERRIGNAAGDIRRPVNGHMVVIRCRAGAKLCKSYRRAGVIFTLQPPGVKVKTKHAHAAIMSGALVPMNDGLFGHVQTWIADPTAPTPTVRARAARARLVSTSAAKDEDQRVNLTR